jgi:outer membrane protein assembly factor BamB
MQIDRAQDEGGDVTFDQQPPRRRPAPIVAAGVALLLVLTAVGMFEVWPSSKPVAAPVKPAPPTVSAPVGDWADHFLHPVSGPVLVGGKVVLYSVEAGHLRLNALDPATGNIAWTMPASVAGNTHGQAFQVAHIGGTVFLLGAPVAADGLEAHVIAVDAATGKQRWATQFAAAFTETPTVCPDHKGLCDSTETAAGTLSSLRINAADGEVRELPNLGGRILGADILDPAPRAPEYVERLSPTTGKLLWRDRVDTLVGGPVSSSYGWNWDSYGAVDVGWLAATSSATQPSLDLSEQKTVGVRASDGKRLWVSKGVYGCPEQGLTGNGKPFAVRCVFKAGGQLDVTLQGFDVRTGKTVWSVPLGNAPAVMPTVSNTVPGAGSYVVVRMGASVFSIPRADGSRVLVDLVNGVVSHPAVPQNGWCLASSYYVDRDNRDELGKRMIQFTGVLLSPCTSQYGVAAPTDGTSTGMGVTVGGRFIWSSPDGVDSYKLPGS